MSSTKRSKKTMRCFPDNRFATFHIFSTCCFATILCSGDICRSGIQSPGVGNVQIRHQRASPEFQTSAGLVIANQIGRDLHQPGFGARIPTKPVASLVRPHEAVLCQIFGRFFIAKRRQNKPEHAWAMLFEHRLKIVERGRTFIHRRRLGGKRSVHPHL